MAAADAVVLENHVRLFVETKVGENISLELSSACVYVRPVLKGGSTTLGAFWARVIQSFYPKGVNNYKKLYSTAVGSEALTVSTFILSQLTITLTAIYRLNHCG